MSHFSVVVLVPRNTPKDREAVQAAVGELLAPYDENINVPEYDKKCYCVGRKAQEEAGKAADKKYGTIDQLRSTFWKTHKPLEMPLIDRETSRDDEKELWTEYNKKEKENDKAWRKHIAPWEKMSEAEFKKHPGKDKPAPKCEECKGKGVSKSTYNPKSKWDWWVIGGRFTGGFTPEYEPGKDPQNIETCDLCEGTGTRKVPVPVDPKWKPKPGECNGCNGKGKKVAFTLAEYGGDIMLASKLPKDYVPFAIVDPKGQWHEKGEMGWWAMVSNEKDEKAWEKEAKDLLSRYDLSLAVLCDLHI